jgi:hypothetical protein
MIKIMCGLKFIIAITFVACCNQVWAGCPSNALSVEIGSTINVPILGSGFGGDTETSHIFVNGVEKATSSNSNISSYNFTPSNSQAGTKVQILGRHTFRRFDSSPRSGSRTCIRDVTVNAKTVPNIVFSLPSSSSVTVPKNQGELLTFSATDGGGNLSSINICQTNSSGRSCSIVKTCSSSGVLSTCSWTTPSTTTSWYNGYALDSNGNKSANSVVKKIEVNSPPIVTLLPNSTQQLNENVALIVTATATDADSNLKSIRLCSALTSSSNCRQIKLCENTVSGVTGSCGHEWFPSENTGNVYVWAEAFDLQNASSKSIPVKVELNSLPIVSLTINGNKDEGYISKVLTDVPVTIIATAIDPENSLSEFKICKYIKNTPKTCASKNVLQTCPSAGGTCTVTASFSEVNEFIIYAYAKDTSAALVEQEKELQVYSGLGVSIVMPNTEVESGVEYPLAVNVAAVTSSLNGQLSHIDIYANGNVKATKTFNCAVNLPINSTQTVTVPWTPGSVEQFKLRAKAFDCDDRSSRLSAQVNVLVRPQTPSVQPSIGRVLVGGNSQNVFTITPSSVAWGNTYAIYENGIRVGTTSAVIKSLTLIKKYDDRRNPTGKLYLI